jgi:hypothetical protein
MQFENANHPLLTVEASDDQGGSVVLASVDLEKTDIFGPHFNLDLTLDYTKLNRSGPLPHGQDKILLTVRVCDDADGDGKCGADSGSCQIALHNPVHQACHFPSAVPVEVWSTHR